MAIGSMIMIRTSMIDRDQENKWSIIIFRVETVIGPLIR